jgi:hypothetical protein
VSVRLQVVLLPAVVLLAALAACSGQPAPPAVTHRVTTPATTTTEGAPNLLWQTPPAQVWPTLVRAVANAKRVHVTGQFVEGGASFDLDVRLQGRDAAECTLTGRSIGTITAKWLAGTLYLKGDARALKRFLPPGAAAGTVAGPWLIRPLHPGDPLVARLYLTAEAVMGLGRTNELYAGYMLRAGPGGLRDYQNGDGQPHYHVPVLGEPRPASMDRTSDERAVHLLFDYDEPWTVSPPPEALAPA